MAPILNGSFLAATKRNLIGTFHVGNFSWQERYEVKDKCVGTWHENLYNV